MGRDVEITLDEIRALATTTLANLRDDAATSRGQFLGAAVGETLFGETPAGLALAGTNKAAHDVFAATVDAVLADLEGFRSRLVDTLNRYTDADSDSETAMRSLSATEAGQQYRMDAVQREELRSHADLLDGNAAAAPQVPPAPDTDQRGF
jgi:hypothetical protein